MISERRGRAASSPAAPSSKRPAATPARRSRCSRRCSGYKCVFVMPDKMCAGEDLDPPRVRRERRRLPDGRRGRRPAQLLPGARKRIADETPNCFYANQYHNPANPEAHYLSTGPEIWEQTGSDSTSSSPAWARAARSAAPASTSRRRSRTPAVGVDPVGSLYYDFVKIGPHHQAVHLQGRGHRRRLLPVDDEPQDPRRDRPRRRQGVLPHDARSRRASRASSSAARAARRWPARSSTPRRASRKENILVLLAATRVQVRLQDLQRRLDARERLPRRRAGPRHRARPLGGRPAREVVTADADARCARSSTRMKRHGISQLPVVENGKLRGIVDEVDLLRHLVKGQRHARLADRRSRSRATTRP